MSGAMGKDGEYVALEWEYGVPAFYVVRGHVDPASAAAAINAAVGLEFTAQECRYGWLKFRFDGYGRPKWFSAEKHEKPNMRVTGVFL
ncbi:MAG: hypothetical protein ACRD22_11790 [Terriglobia bacterium]